MCALDMLLIKAAYLLTYLHRRNNRRDRRRLVPHLLGWGTNHVLVPNFLAVVFKKQKKITVTRMQDLASEF